MLKLPSVLTDHAVLQHSRNVALWGWSNPGQTVSLFFRGASATAVPGPDGRFEVTLESGSPGGPFELVIQAGEDTVVVHDVLVGEVWLCSGQSNMEFALRDANGAEDEIAQARHSRLRLITIPQTAADTPAQDVPGKWVQCTPESAAMFSAVGFHFGKQLHQQLNIPIGLICSAWGGTTAEAWTPREHLLANPTLAYMANTGEPKGPHLDPGTSAEASMWHGDSLDDRDWAQMECPQAWERTGLNIDGAVWFRKTVEVPADWAGNPLLLSLDLCDDFDQTFFNGVKVGATGPETPTWWSVSRRYMVPAEHVRPGKNVIAVRIFDQWGDGGLLGKAERMYLSRQADESRQISLAGLWRYKVELALPPRSVDAATKPTSLFNGMISPLVPFTIKGAIWYQGESNVDRAFEYRTLFPTMIQSWREAWKDELAFLFVLLAGWHAHPLQANESKIAELRDAQLSAMALPGVLAASAVDVGDIEDIHPREKKVVGARLAAAALAGVYSRQVEGTGPTFHGLEVSGSEVRLTFDHADGLHARGPEARGFAVAGEDGLFYWAKARIEANTVVLNCNQVSAIKSVRYAWSDNPLANLYNSAALPMVPFRTDSLPYTTAPIAEEYGRLG